MSVESAVRAGRRAAEARMLDTADIVYATGATTRDPVTGSEVPVYATRFTTRCRVKSTRTYGVQNQQVGGRTAQVVSREFHMPVDSPTVYPGDIAVMVEIDAMTDPMLDGARLTLSGPAPGSQSTARRLEVTEIVA